MYGDDAKPSRVDMTEGGRERALRALRDTPAAELAARRAELQDAAQRESVTPKEVEAVLNARPVNPRPLLPGERRTLLMVLRQPEFPGRDALLAQVDPASVVGYCGRGCASVQLAVADGPPAATETRSVIPNEATVVDEDGEPVEGILVFLTDGYLSLLEVYDHGDRISPFPPAERLRPAPPPQTRPGPRVAAPDG
jgi:hypothetical protein